MKTWYRFVCATAAALALGSAHAELVVVAGASSGMVPLTPQQVSALFLGRVDFVLGVGPPLVVDLPQQSEIRLRFYPRATGRSAPAASAARAALVFSGRASPAVELQDPDAVKRFLVENPAAVGYLDRMMLDDSIKVLATVE